MEKRNRDAVASDTASIADTTSELTPLTMTSTPDMVMDAHANKGENIKIELVRMLESSFSGASTKKIKSVVDKVLSELEAEESMKGTFRRESIDNSRRGTRNGYDGFI